MTLEGLQQILQEAIRNLYENDKYLFENKVSERAISHKLACYIGQLVSQRAEDSVWHVDAEYNRNIDAPKTLISDGQKTCVVPDILIHRRGLNNDGDIRDNNLLVVEIKKNAKKDGKEKDIYKIKAFINEDPYCYKYELFINFKTRAKATTHKLHWFCRDNENSNCEDLEIGI